jgi:hypothetical protein
MNELIPLAISLIALIISLISVYKALEVPKILENGIENAVSVYESEIEKWLKPIDEKISKSYSHLGTKGATAKQVKKMDQLIGQDILDQQDPLLKTALELFPNASEYVEKNPHLLQELLPRLQALKGDPDFKITDLISPSPSRNPNPSKHPYGRLEE